MQKEIEAIRKIILGANKKISERMKSNAPSYFYKEEIGAFNPKAMSSVQFVIQFPKGIPKGDYGDLLEGSFKDKRIMMFSDMEDIKGKKSALIKVMNDWCELVG